MYSEYSIELRNMQTIDIYMSVDKLLQFIIVSTL